MVSVHPNPQPGQQFTHFYNVEFGGDPMPAMKAAENNGFPKTASFWSDGAGVEDPTPKVRKPYTITKSRENWTEMEHEKFLEALHLFDRDWKKIKAFVGSKTVIQEFSGLPIAAWHKDKQNTTSKDDNCAIRSHAQKYFMKIQKNGMSEHVPPARPKRKAAHPYPQKAPKKACVVASRPSEPLYSTAYLNSKYAMGPKSMSLNSNITGIKPLHPRISMVPTGSASSISRDDLALSGGSVNGSSNTSDVALCRWASKETNNHVKENAIENRALPDFAQVYRFIGSVFDPSAREHLEELRKMDPIDIETVLMLMDNLSVNLVSPEFEHHRKLLSSYNIDIQNKRTSSETSS